MMPITIEWPDGTTTQPTRRTDVNEVYKAQSVGDAQMIAGMRGQDLSPKPKRTIGVVATELQEAIDTAAAGRLAQQEVVILRAELDKLIGKAPRKPRAPKSK
jgi:hypothetical protein